MNPIEKDELYRHLGQFLKAKGIELKDGSYTQTIQKSCGMLTDVINLSQKGMERAKGEVDKKLDQLRQVIHEKTAPRARVNPTVVCSPPATEAKATAPQPQAARPQTRKTKTGTGKPKSGKAKK